MKQFLKNIDNTWTLFLDRDGVLNFEKKNDYIRHVDEFVLYEGVVSALKNLSKKFQKIIIVTNQRGIGKGLMTHQNLEDIHKHLFEILKANEVKIDAFYYAPDLDLQAPNRKPNVGMGLQAKKDFPEIDFEKSVMVGNNISDMIFGKNLGMNTVFLHTTNPLQRSNEYIDYFYNSLLDFSLEFV